MKYTNEQLNRTLAKMLPEKIYYDLWVNRLFHKGEIELEVLDTELLHLA